MTYHVQASVRARELLLADFGLELINELRGILLRAGQVEAVSDHSRDLIGGQVVCALLVYIADGRRLHSQRLGERQEHLLDGILHISPVRIIQ